ncbi:MAG: 4Fe-4S binding protein [Fidelibacterota bacterium]
MMKRSVAEKMFLVFFIPSVIFFYLIYKYPLWFVNDVSELMFLGKNLSFWYALFYTILVDVLAMKVLLGKKNVYSVNKKQPGHLSSYQFWKFVSIVIVQTVVFFGFPYVIGPLLAGNSFWSDVPAIASKKAHIYIYPGFLNWGLAAYLFVLIPATVWFLGKRYCTWFCSCGNLAETVGSTKWGQKWVRQGTPRGERAKNFEHLETIVLSFVLLFGFLLLLDSTQIITADSVVDEMKNTQDLVIDLIFGSIVGVGAYPFLGTRVWCRYGCPLAKGMQLVGRFTRSRFRVKANENCTGYNLCSRACPMGIDVASYAHVDRKPIMGSFGLEEPCIGCGGCISICPTQGLKFQSIFNKPIRVNSENYK